ncbi:MAG: CoA transferase [Acidimicrobiales bacterium]
MDDRPGSAPMGSKGRVPIYRLFRCADDRWLFMACGTLRFWERMLQLIGRADLLGDPRLPSPPWGLVAPDAVAFIAPLLEEVFETRPREEWLRLLREADIPVQPVQSREEFLASSLAISNELSTTVTDPVHGPVRIGGRPVRFANGDGAVVTAAPAPGAHDEAVAAELGNAGTAATAARRARSARVDRRCTACGCSIWPRSSPGRWSAATWPCSAPT